MDQNGSAIILNNISGQNRGPIKQAPVYCHNHRVGDPSHECCCPPCYMQSGSGPTIMSVECK